MPAGRAVRRLALGCIVAGLVALPPLLRPDPFGTLARRFLAPWLDLDRVGMVLLTVAPGDAVVALGSDLDVTARVEPRLERRRRALPDAAWLEWDDRDHGHDAPRPDGVARPGIPRVPELRGRGCPGSTAPSAIG